LFLRGGADGLALVPPWADPELTRLRPTLAPRPPGKNDASVVDIDGRFGLAPALSALAPSFRAGELAIVHAVGSDDDTRSHFEAQDRMELAGTTAASAAGGGIARHLSTRPGPRAGALAAVAFGARPPESLRGVAATTVDRLSEYAVPALTPALGASLAGLYASEESVPLPLAPDLATAGTSALSVADRIEALSRRAGARRDRYPQTALGGHLAEAAHVLRHREELGVEVITVDQQGWDTHFVQTTAIEGVARDLADSLAALRADLDDALADVVVVAMTEFGRRAHENVSLGTDHGRGSVMFVLGAGVRGGRVHGAFPGLSPEALTGPGDLAVTTDYRSVLADLLGGPLANPRAGEVFPGAPLAPTGVAAG
jgi:uncharacterized protein (DUF1501 family)